MGTLTYAGIVVEFDDRLLTHLQIVIMQKFRRGQSFAMSWIDDPQVGDGRSSLWLTPTSPAYFKFLGSRVPAVDQQWIDRLNQSADSTRGLIVTDVEGVAIKAHGNAPVSGRPGRPAQLHHS